MRLELDSTVKKSTHSCMCTSLYDLLIILGRVEGSIKLCSTKECLIDGVSETHSKHRENFLINYFITYLLVLSASRLSWAVHTCIWFHGFVVYLYR